MSMAYCFALISEGDVSFEGRLGTKKTAELSGDRDGRTIDTDYLGRCITRAESDVNNYCRKQYTVPFDAVSPAVPPEGIPEITLDLAIYYAYKNRGASMSADVRQSYEDAVKKLEGISSGKLVLDVTDTEAVPTVGPKTGGSVNSRLFYRD